MYSSCTVPIYINVEFKYTCTALYSDIQLNMHCVSVYIVTPLSAMQIRPLHMGHGLKQRNGKVLSSNLIY